MTIEAQIERMISERSLSSGDKLPTERELASLLEQPRSAVRNALLNMENSGRIWRHVGRGTFIGQRPTQTESMSSLGNVLDETNPAEVLETRLILEPTLAARAAMRATPSQVNQLREIVRFGDAAATFEEYEHWDAAFHELVVAAAHNKLCEKLYRYISDARSHSVWGRLKRASLSTERRACYQLSHNEITLAISDRDTDAAKRLMSEHIQEVRQNMLGS